MQVPSEQGPSRGCRPWSHPARFRLPCRGAGWGSAFKPTLKVLGCQDLSAGCPALRCRGAASSLLPRHQRRLSSLSSESGQESGSSWPQRTRGEDRLVSLRQALLLNAARGLCILGAPFRAETPHQPRGFIPGSRHPSGQSGHPPVQPQSQLSRSGMVGLAQTLETTKSIPPFPK